MWLAQCQDTSGWLSVKGLQNNYYPVLFGWLTARINLVGSVPKGYKINSVLYCLIASLPGSLSDSFSGQNLSDSLNARIMRPSWIAGHGASYKVS